MEFLLREYRAAPEPLAGCAVRKNGARCCIVGGGGTGAALAYDLAQRGFSVTLFERGELVSGATGRHQGQLHSGARYAAGDPETAKTCYEESLVLARIAGECIEYNGGFFIALTEGEAAFEPEFVNACSEAGIPWRRITPGELAGIEPLLTRAVRSAVRVPDGSFDAFRLPLMFFAAARRLGAGILPWHEAVGIRKSPGGTWSVTAKDIVSRHDITIDADFVINAAGAWAGRVAGLAGLSVPLAPARGTMVALEGRLVRHVISRMRMPSEGDILLPQRGLTIAGTTRRRTETPDAPCPDGEEIEFLLRAAEEMVPGISTKPLRASWASPRVIEVQVGHATSWSAPGSLGIRSGANFTLIDHGAAEGAAGFATIVGGRATAARAMAEKTADLVCDRLGVYSECRTGRFALPSWRDYYRMGR